MKQKITSVIIRPGLEAIREKDLLFSVGPDVQSDLVEYVESR